MSCVLKDGMTILFQGDSITDCGRTTDSTELGAGYPVLVSETCHALRREMGLHFVNRGVSGNRCRNLLERYQKDFAEVHPDILSILIGVNDTWRRFDQNDPCSAERFEKEYRTLLEQIRRDMPDCQIILMQPFLLHTNPDQWDWREDLDAKATLTARMAREYNTMYIPLQGMFDRLVTSGIAPASLSQDGVHPTALGHRYIAMEYMKMLGIFDHE